MTIFLSLLFLICKRRITTPILQDCSVVAILRLKAASNTLSWCSVKLISSLPVLLSSSYTYYLFLDLKENAGLDPSSLSCPLGFKVSHFIHSPVALGCPTTWWSRLILHSSLLLSGCWGHSAYLGSPGHSCFWNFSFIYLRMGDGEE